MKNKRIFKTFSALCAALVLMMGLSVTAFAQGTDQPPAEDATNDTNVVVEETEDSPALTPDGNAALVDDFGGNKQLITVTTKAGNYFYIRIDQEIAKTREKIAEQQEKLKDLEAQKTEAENLEIVQMVRALRLTPEQLNAMLSGGTVPGMAAASTDYDEQEDTDHEE